MQEFSYSRPSEESAVLDVMVDPETVAIAGGTELLNWMRLGISKPKHVVDLGGLSGRAGVTLDQSWLTVGASTDLNTVGQHPLVREHATALGEACLKAASAQVRNRATLGGNVLQRTRCAYFRAEEPLPWACNKRAPGSGCAALEGANDQHAIFGWTTDCVATQPSDPLVALACLGAEVEIVSRAGRGWSPVAELHLTQQEAAERGGEPATHETRLPDGSLISAYRIPVQPDLRSSYVKVRERESYAYALVSAAASLRLEGTTIRQVRIVLGSVAQRPWRLTAAEPALEGQVLTEELVKSALDEALREARPLRDNAYKVALARNAATRAIMTAARA